MSSEIKKTEDILRHHPLDSGEVLKIANANGKVAQFLTYDQIKELPQPGHSYVVLLRANEHFGHYVGLLNHGNVIEWYDAYAYKPDRELKWQTANQNAKLGQDAPRVSHLMREFLDAGGKLDFNEDKFQDEGNSKDESCGYQVGVRILNHRMNISHYQKWLAETARAHQTTPSNVVIQIGADILGQPTGAGSGYLGGSSSGIFEGGLFELSKNMPKQVKEWLNRNGEKTIKRITIWRVPLGSFLQKALSGITLGKSRKAYDELFHLYTVFLMEDDSLELIEKNQRVNVQSGNKVQSTVEKKGSEGRGVKTPSGVTLNEYINNAVAKIPNDQLWVYSLLQNNCQKFTLDLLQSNGLLTDELKKFIYQDPSVIASSNGFLSSLANSATNLANRFNTLIHGGALVVYGGKLYQVNEVERGGERFRTIREATEAEIAELREESADLRRQVNEINEELDRIFAIYNPLFDQYDHLAGVLNLREANGDPVTPAEDRLHDQLEARLDALRRQIDRLQTRARTLGQRHTAIQDQIRALQEQLA